MKKIVFKNLFVNVFVLFAIFCICSCGFRGPLYMPKKQTASSPQKTTASKPANTVVTPTVVIPTGK
ncbi:MAG: hypothetical protein K0R14_975 [Burkholderiales bacterium]|jgi:predicted small lipoprotein YifL|nr:hypothetical protein [Burkholderiales bacterium]